MSFAAPSAVELVAFTPESAQAALQLGPVEFVCNACGERHVSSDDSAIDQCVSWHCHMASARLYRDCDLKHVFDAVKRLENVLWRFVEKNSVGANDAANMAWFSLGDLTDALRFFDCASDSNGSQSMANAIFGYVVSRNSLPWLLMVSKQHADTEIAACFPALLFALARGINTALRNACFFTCSCDYYVCSELGASFGVLRAELDRLCRACPEIFLDAVGGLHLGETWRCDIQDPYAARINNTAGDVN